MGTIKRDLGQGEDEEHGSRGVCALERKRREAWFCGIIVRTRIDLGEHSECTP